eukprot:5829232-Alexandrium_andersonii.AAC.1
MGSPPRADTDAGMSAAPERGVRASTYAREHAGASALNWAQGPETWALRPWRKLDWAKGPEPV